MVKTANVPAVIDGESGSPEVTAFDGNPSTPLTANETGAETSDETNVDSADREAAAKPDLNEIVEYQVRPDVEAIMGKRLKKGQTTVTMSRRSAQHLVLIEQIAEGPDRPKSWARCEETSHGAEGEAATA